ncbi:hypothetical protein [Tengunoibacter tsumagoiensis]|uniref:Uncharacterized protein n=1 Tax=Tengunoibacter tsumagoiensis TaxID=2014871 RepID=A0A402AAN8_9CHLR|nr:hypothetical protein [Tengunoibacter tsumagoiensis]GCE16015.1 hypothetical protein KTT_58740 [Tengunoibacter tsumagoiensis]
MVKKVTVAILIIGAFILYSLLFNHADSVAIVPTSTSTSSSSTDSPGSANSPGSSSNAGSTDATPPTTSNNTSTTSTQYKDGSYTGSVADAHWGNLQVKAIIKNGKITDVQFLQYPIKMFCKLPQLISAAKYCIH